MASRNDALPDRAGKSHEGQERNVLLRRKREATPQLKFVCGSATLRQGICCPIA
jgi:hypothetical protein